MTTTCARQRHDRRGGRGPFTVALDESPVFDDGDPAELSRDYRELVEMLPNLAVPGGCRGTDARHTAISHACGHAHAG